MMVTGSIGIMIVKKLGARIPKLTIKIIAASVFMFFGITKLYQTIPIKFLNMQNISIFIGVIAIVIFIMLRQIINRRR